MHAPINTADFLHAKLRMLPHVERLQDMDNHILVKPTTLDWSSHKVCDLKALILFSVIGDYANIHKDDYQLVIATTKNIISSLLNARVSSVYQTLAKEPTEVFSNFDIFPNEIPRDPERINMFAYTINAMGIDFFVKYLDDNGEEITSISFISLGWINTTQVVTNDPSMQEIPNSIQ